MGEGNGAPNRRALRSPLPFRNPANRQGGTRRSRPTERKNRCRHDDTVGAIHESPAAQITIPTQAGWIVSSNKIPPRLPLGGKAISFVGADDSVRPLPGKAKPPGWIVWHTAAIPAPPSPWGEGAERSEADEGAMTARLP